MLLMILGPLIVLGIAGALVFSQRYGSGQTDVRIDEKELRTASEALARREAELMSVPGVVGVGLGLTEKGDRPAIHVFLNVRATGGTPPPAIPKQIGDVPVRVIATDEIKAR